MGAAASTTAALESVGWHGLIVEASMDRVRCLQETRPLATAVRQAVVCDAQDMVHFVDSGGPGRGGGGGVLQYMPDLYLQGWHPDLRGQPGRAAPNAPCSTLASVLQDSGLSHANFLAEDVVRDHSAGKLLSRC